MDSDGHLWLVGRAKEIINRGGEKIAPLEIDGVFAEHPDVREAAAFAIPHPTLGEEIGLAVVARGRRPAPEELLAFASAKLATFKLPAKIIFLDRLPRGPTGKITRRVLQTQRPVPEDASNGPPIGRKEQLVAAIWSNVFGVSPIDRQATFSGLGGSSHTAALVLRLLETTLGHPIPIAAIAKVETVREMAQVLATFIPERNWPQ
jgi:hypothetical protein